jgi:hypothetical protein
VAVGVDVAVAAGVAVAVAVGVGVDTVGTHALGRRTLVTAISSR